MNLFNPILGVFMLVMLFNLLFGIMLFYFTLFYINIPFLIAKLDILEKLLIRFSNLGL
jgi:hypothetical protein